MCKTGGPRCATHTWADLQKATRALKATPKPTSMNHDGWGAWNSAREQFRDALAEHAATPRGRDQVERRLAGLSGKDADKEGDLKWALVEGDRRRQAQAERADAIRARREGRPLRPQQATAGTLNSYHVGRTFEVPNPQQIFGDDWPSSVPLKGEIVDVHRHRDGSVTVEYNSPNSRGLWGIPDSQVSLPPHHPVAIWPSDEQRTAYRDALSDRITADSIRESTVRTPWYATTDQGGNFSVVAFTDAGVIVRARRTGALARIVQTGSKVRRDGQVRIRMEFARDTGDQAGTLAFDDTKTGGLVPAEVFDQASDTRRAERP